METEKTGRNSWDATLVIHHFGNKITTLEIGERERHKEKSNKIQ